MREAWSSDNVVLILEKGKRKDLSNYSEYINEKHNNGKANTRFN